MTMSEPIARRWVREPNPVHFPESLQVPEGKEHLELRTALYQILKSAFANRAWIGSDQFVYWDPTDPKACLAPDVFVRLGGPDEIFGSWKVWERGAPHLAVEIVSPLEPGDARVEPKLDKYRRLGVQELVRFDPDEATEPLRIWDQIDGDLVERILPANALPECGPLELFWVVDHRADRPSLRLAKDPEGREMLPTPQEQADRANDAVARATERIRELEEALSRKS